ncbi:MAG: hypothetical protein AAB092_09305 [Chloroflexota bacterium]
MSANEPNTESGGGTRVIFTGEQRNPLLSFLQRPRIMLLLLAVWSILGVLPQVFTESAIFFDNKGREIDGALGGFALGWEGVPLAAVYIYAFRNPDRHRPVFWLALIHMAAMAASQLYHLGTGDFSFESIIVPLAGSGGLSALVFLHLFGPKESPAEAAKPD